MNVEEILKRLKELQDPLDWQPGIDALVQDIEESLKRYIIRTDKAYWAFSGWTTNKKSASHYPSDEAQRELWIRQENGSPRAFLEEVK